MQCVTNARLSRSASGCERMAEICRHRDILGLDELQMKKTSRARRWDLTRSLLKTREDSQGCQWASFRSGQGNPFLHPHLRLSLGWALAPAPPSIRSSRAPSAAAALTIPSLSFPPSHAVPVSCLQCDLVPSRVPPRYRTTSFPSACPTSDAGYNPSFMYI